MSSLALALVFMPPLSRGIRVMTCSISRIVLCAEDSNTRPSTMQMGLCHTTQDMHGAILGWLLGPGPRSLRLAAASCLPGGLRRGNSITRCLESTCLRWKGLRTWRTTARIRSTSSCTHVERLQHWVATWRQTTFDAVDRWTGITWDLNSIVL